jgi:protein-L-isoaspartate(D-aspartate) O-methyltransferase
MEKVPRHIFIPDELVASGYEDTPLYIGEGQTISAPHMVAIMLEIMDLEPGMKVLEIGAGSGYNAALMAELVRPNGHVYSIERIDKLSKKARGNIERAGYGDLVTVITADGSKGWKDEAPYDRIVVTAASPGIPKPLKDQLKDGGILLIPAGNRLYQDLVKITRHGEEFSTENLGEVVFVPLIGEHGYHER